MFERLSTMHVFFSADCPAVRGVPLSKSIALAFPLTLLPIPEIALLLIPSTVHLCDEYCFRQIGYVDSKIPGRWSHICRLFDDDARAIYTFRATVFSIITNIAGPAYTSAGTDLKQGRCKPRLQGKIGITVQIHSPTTAC
jgi:hypothetical protein